MSNNRNNGWHRRNGSPVPQWFKEHIEWLKANFEELHEANRKRDEESRKRDEEMKKRDTYIADLYELNSGLIDKLGKQIKISETKWEKQSKVNDQILVVCKEIRDKLKGT